MIQSSWFASPLATVSHCEHGERMVSVALSQPADPDTTKGARLRVWSMEDLASWDERAGADDVVFVDAASQRIRIFNDDVVIAGAINMWPDGSSGPTAQVPAVWVSHAGAPFVAHVLPDESGDPSAGWVHDLTATSEEFVAVGGDGGRARAWDSTDLDDWIPAVVIDPEPLSRSGGGAMWSVAADGESLVASSVGDPGVATPTDPSGSGGWIFPDHVAETTSLSANRFGAAPQRVGGVAAVRSGPVVEPQ